MLFILPGQLFENVRARAKDDNNLNETLERIFKNIEATAIGTESEKNFKGLFDDIDVNSNKLGSTVEKIFKIIIAFILINIQERVLRKKSSMMT